MPITNVEMLPQGPFNAALGAAYPAESAYITPGMCFILSLKWLECGLLRGQNADTILTGLYGMPLNSASIMSLVQHQHAYATATDDADLAGTGIAYPAAGPKSALVSYFLRAMTGNHLRAHHVTDGYAATTAAHEQTAANQIVNFVTGAPGFTAAAGMTLTQAAIVCMDSATGHHCIALRLIGNDYYLFDPAVGVMKVVLPPGAAVAAQQAAAYELLHSVTTHQQLTAPVTFTLAQVVRI